jgi:subtilisin family serine protease
MPRSWSRLFRCSIASMVLLGSGVSAAAVGPAAASNSSVEGEVQRRMSAHGSARVSVVLRVAAAGDGSGLSPTRVADAQDRVLGRIDRDEIEIHHRFRTLPGFAATVSPAALDALRADPNVISVEIDEAGQGHLAESLAVTRADRVQAEYGLTGAGVTVAVLDSGVDTDHPDLAAAIVAQHCFTNNNCPPGSTAEGSSAEDEHGHGTHVTGIVASRGVQSSVGYAPGASIVAVRVLDSSNGGFLSDWTAGLEWVYANREAYNVRLINMSLGSFALYPGVCDTQEPLMAAAVNQLVGAGITIFASSGNAGSSSRIAAPACLSGVIAVGATYDSDLGAQNNGSCSDAVTSATTIACFTNSNAQLDLLAPGSQITSSALGGGTTVFRGTSMASPSAAGVAALLLQRNPHLTPAQIESILESTGTPITDGRNGLTFPLIDAYNAVGAVPPVYGVFLPLMIR